MLAATFATNWLRFRDGDVGVVDGELAKGIDGFYGK
jgi:hypothetical protein